MQIWQLFILVLKRSLVNFVRLEKTVTEMITECLDGCCSVERILTAYNYPDSAHLQGGLKFATQISPLPNC